MKSKTSVTSPAVAARCSQGRHVEADFNQLIAVQSVGMRPGVKPWMSAGVMLSAATIAGVGCWRCRYRYSLSHNLARSATVETPEQRRSVVNPSCSASAFVLEESRVEVEQSCFSALEAK